VAASPHGAAPAPAGAAAAVSAAQAAEAAHAPIRRREFVAVIAALMALNALAIDAMLPALQEIGAALGEADPNRRPLVLTAYMAGFGLGQLVVGTISDRFGRRPVLLAGLAAYVAAAAACAAAPDFATMLAARVVQGLASAAPRVVALAVVRDCYSGRAMARLMSLAMTVFMAVPVVAPSLGQLVILAAPWRAIFGLLAAFGTAMLLWTALRLPETLPPARRLPLSPTRVAGAFRSVASNRQTVGYGIACGLMFGAMFGFLASAELVFDHVFGLGPWFPAAFAAIAGTIALSSFLNSRLVERFGMRVLSHGATAVFVALSALLLGLALAGLLGFAAFMAVFGAMTCLVGMIFSNMNALAMEPQGHVAGTASSMLGCATTLIAASIGTATGMAFDGTVVPMAAGYLLCGAAALAVVAWTERGRLFRGGSAAAGGH
jgi:DHA1 family bicyclomycin/chloramphenicol resistance-like MFS transporter